MMVENTMAQSQLHAGDQATFARRVLLANTLFSSLSGLLFVVDGGYVATFLGLPSPTAAWVIRGLGVGLLLFALLIYQMTRQPALSKGGLLLILEADLLWVIGSAVLLWSGWLPLSATGWWAVAIVADIVALFAILEFVGWRRMA
ncbi:MAG: hypothetical protein R3C14_07855 [Caldilineaceae bacterium]